MAAAAAGVIGGNGLSSSSWMLFRDTQRNHKKRQIGLRFVALLL